MRGCSRAPRSVSIAITGASGVIVGLKVLEALRDLEVDVKGVIVTRSAVKVAEYEEAITQSELESSISKIAPLYYEDELDSPLASSSNQPEAMAIVPASMKTVASIANGLSGNLVARAALSILRLGRKLVVAPRETPIGVIEIENMLKLAKAGAIIVPLCVAYYTNPKTINDITMFLAGKVLDALGFEHNLYKRWEGPSQQI